MKQSKLGFWAFLFPCLLTFILTVLVPAITGFYYSFTDWNGIGASPNFIGLANYVEVFRGGSQFWNTFLYTFLFSLCTIGLVNLLGFLLALLVTQKFPGAKVLRSVFFMPNLIGGILVGFTWQFIFIQVFNFLGETFNVPFLQNWLSTRSTGTIGMLVVVVWQMSGYIMLIYIAQLHNIPDELLEAAQIDGAGPWRRLRHITLPLMLPAFTIGVFFTLSSTFKMFDQNLTLTNGGPARSTELLALNIYRTAFTENDLGLAQAKAVIFLVAVAAVGLAQLRFSKSREVEM